MSPREPQARIEEFVDRLRTSLLAGRLPCRGCSSAEIEEIASGQNVALPAAYRAFLSMIGRGCGDFLVGSDCFYPAVLNVRDYAMDLLREGGVEAGLPDDAFVFLCHQGYEFLFFKTADHAEDPAVYFYAEGMAAPEHRWSAFSEFLSATLNEQLAVRKRFQSEVGSGL